MSPQYFALTPQDAWFFRDGRPYNHKESNQADVECLFPPAARTLTGAFRAALARANGWNGEHGEWPEPVTKLCGDGPNNLGQLRFTGPFVIRQDTTGNQVALWPLPRHVLGRSYQGAWEPAVLLQPALSKTQTDRDAQFLPEIPIPPCPQRDGLKPAENAWISATGLANVLEGKPPQPNAVVRSNSLWRFEQRVGLARHPATLNVDEGDLYSPSYVRLCRKVALGVGLAGVRGNMKSPPGLFPLGGESRLTHCEPWDGHPLPEALSADSFKAGPDDLIRFTVVLLTPGRFDDPAPLLSPNARTASACVGKPTPIGGWNSLKNEPLPLEPFHPAGSVWFCEAPAPEFPSVLAQHGQWLGDYTAHGFGQLVIGYWPSTHPSLP